MTDWNGLAPDDDTRAFAEAARAQFAALRGPAALRASIDGVVVHEQEKVWDALVAGGYLDIGMPESVGGLGRLIDLVVVLEEAGRSLLAAPLLATILSLQTRAAAGLDEGRAAPQGFAFAEGTVEDGTVTVARAHVLGADVASSFTLLVRDAATTWVAVLEKSADGVETQEDVGVIDPSRKAPAVTVGTVRAEAWNEAPRAVAIARLCIAADLIGTAAGALEMAVEHVLQRSQFGQPLGAFQAVKHQLADAYVAVERARSLTYGAALEPNNQDVLLANAAAVEAAVHTSSRYVQLMGAMGVTFEAEPHLYLRRAHHSAALFGSADDLYLSGARMEKQ
jgi:alkylation response protein AidB-like acyl-CoA dehydrogenase